MLEKLKEERDELATRLENLSNFLADHQRVTQSEIPGAQINLMWWQRKAMGEYLDILITVAGLQQRPFYFTPG